MQAFSVSLNVTSLEVVTVSGSRPGDRGSPGWTKAVRIKAVSDDGSVSLHFTTVEPVFKVGEDGLLVGQGQELRISVEPNLQSELHGRDEEASGPRVQ